MAIEYLDFTDDTLPLVSELVVSRFGNGAIASLRKILANPLRRQVIPAGCIAFRDGRAVCFKASMVRRLYFGQEELLGLVGGYFCKAVKGCPLSAVLEVQARAEWNRYPCRLRFGNTCIYTTMRLNAQLGAHQGTNSWSEMRFGIVRPIRLAGLFLRRKLLRLPQPEAALPVVPPDETTVYAASGGLSVRRLRSVDERIGNFWRRYLSNNRGVVLSRDRETLDWLFGSDIATGRCVLLALRRDDEGIDGFIVLRPMEDSPCRWRIMDMIVLGNAPEPLYLLLKGAKRFLRRETSAITLESTGFPDFVQPILRRYLPFRRHTGHNRFEWISDDPTVIEVLTETGNTVASWFYGPFDGDYCL